MSPSTHILYHSPCMDGMAAALAAFLALGDSAKYHPVKYGDPPPVLPANASVILLDFSYKREVLEAFAKTVNNVVVLDHHKTAAEDLAGYPAPGFADPIAVIFDMEKSGAVMAYEYFHGATGGEVPKFFRLVEDRDLWRFSYEETKAVMAALQTFPMAMEDYAVAYADYTKYPLAFASRGQVILNTQNAAIDVICKTAVFSRAFGQSGVFVSCNVYQSEVCDKLLNDFPEASFAAAFYQQTTTHQKWSLRSRKGGFDVSEVAKKFGGGGHAAAAGFSIPAFLPDLDMLAEAANRAAY